MWINHLTAYMISYLNNDKYKALLYIAFQWKGTVARQEGLDLKVWKPKIHDFKLAACKDPKFVIEDPWSTYKYHFSISFQM